MEAKMSETRSNWHLNNSLNKTALTQKKDLQWSDFSGNIQPSRHQWQWVTDSWACFKLDRSSGAVHTVMNSCGALWWGPVGWGKAHYPDRASQGEFGCFQIRSILSPAFVHQPTTAAWRVVIFFVNFFGRLSNVFGDAAIVWESAQPAGSIRQPIYIWIVIWLFFFNILKNIKKG